MKLNIKQLIAELQKQQNPFMLLLIEPPGVGKQQLLLNASNPQVLVHALHQHITYSKTW